VVVVGSGLTLVVVGALLAFAVKDDLDGVNLPVAGLILMIAGAVVMWHARATAQHEEEVERREESDDPAIPTHTVREIHRERRERRTD
jgi:uncharacterized sodium:solute symporter family permease YidK